MSQIERAKLIPVTGNNDRPDMNNAVDVQFNPTSLKVSLSNTLKENPRSGNSRASQFVDKSSSSLTVELIFDTTWIEAPAGGAAGDQGSSRNNIEQGSDVRLQTRKIADTFIKPVGSGAQLRAPKRCLFQWGSFEFLGLVESFEETLDFFSPKGRPLRATVALKLKEDRYQFRSNDRDALAAAQSPQLSFTGSGGGEPGDETQGNGAGNNAAAAGQTASPVPGSSEGAGNWRDNAMFNGVETPRLPAAPSLALPSVNLSAGAGFGISGGVGIGLDIGAGIGIGLDVNLGLNLNASVSASLNLSASVGGGIPAGGSTGSSSGTAKSGGGTASTTTTSPAFKFGNSGALGTGVPGAFSPAGKAPLQASGLQSGSLKLRAEPALPSANGGTVPAAASTGTSTRNTTRQTGAGARQQHGLSVTALLKNNPDNGVGFD